MRILRSFFIAFSCYSKIPVPQFEWKDADMKYIFCFFPWVGAVIGFCIYGWNIFCDRCQIGTLCRVSIDIAIPLFLTGGFHADGFLDTMDALHSYQPKERKLEILKDSHIGAFAVIMIAVCGLIWLGAFSEIKADASLKIVCSGFFLSRCLCGISVVTFPLAKENGMLFAFTRCSNKKTVKCILYLQSVICMCFMINCSLHDGIIVSISSLVSFVYYKYRCIKEFGGITGDTSGYFVLLNETCMLAAAALSGIL